MMTALRTILPEDNDGSPVLSLPSLPKKMRKASHQHQVDCQNKQKAKEAFVEALAQATMLVAAERGKEKEDSRLTLSIIKQVKGEFRAHSFEVSLIKPTVNHYVWSNMIGSAPLARGYERIIPKAVFKLLVLTVKLIIQMKQVNCKVIVQKQLLVLVNKMCEIKSVDQIKENMLERVMRLMTVSFNITIAPPVEERRLHWTTYDNLHMWFMSFKEFLIKFGFATLNGNGALVFLPEILRCIDSDDKRETLLDRSNTQAGGHPAMSYQNPHLPMIMR
jgi:hypothetical protein